MNKLEDAGTYLDRYQKVNNHLKELYKKKDSMFRQKSRMDWIDLSDGNTKFFHQAIQRRIFKSSIKKNYLKVDGYQTQMKLGKPSTYIIRSFSRIIILNCWDWVV